MRNGLLTLRPAGPGDRERIWGWANDPAVRAASFRQAPIPWEDHVAWYDRQLADPAVRFLVVEESGHPVGQVRFDLSPPDAEVHITVAPGQRGRGLGSGALRLACDRLATGEAVRRIVAHVRPSNPASLAAFERAGFRREGTVVVRGREAVRLALDPAAPAGSRDAP